MGKTGAVGWLGVPTISLRNAPSVLLCCYVAPRQCMQALVGLMVSQLVTVGCRSPSPTPVAVSARSEVTTAADSSSPASNSSPSEHIFEDCRGVKSGQFVCNGKERVECHADARGQLIESCPEACADGVCTCAYGPEPTCTAQPTAPCTEQGPNVPIIDIARGRTHTCALFQGGCVRCWTGALLSTGKETTAEALERVDKFPSDKGQIGIPGRTRADQRSLWDSGANVDLGAKVIAISAGEDHTCAIVEGGCVKCWGANDAGQLGVGNTKAVGDDEAPAVVPPVRLGGPAKTIALGFKFSCALMVDGSVRCWGRNELGQLGLGNTKNLGDKQSVLSACPVSVGSKVEMLACGNTFTCALTKEGGIRCWGDADFGVLGLSLAVIRERSGPLNYPGSWSKLAVGDDELPSDMPLVPLPSPAILIAAGSTHACAQLTSHSVHCWGDNLNYQLGVEEPEHSEQPLGKPLNIARIAPGAVSLGVFHTCVETRDGQVYCVGSNRDREYFQMDCCGRGRTIENGGLFPGFRVASNIGKPKKLIGGAFRLGPCALVSDTTIRCWNAQNGY